MSKTEMNLVYDIVFCPQTHGVILHVISVGIEEAVRSGVGPWRIIFLLKGSGIK